MKGSRALKLVFISILFLVGLTVQFATAPSVHAEKLRLTLGTSPIGGTWYPMAAGLAELWNREIPSITVTVEGSGGGSTNPKWLSSGKLDIALTTLDMVFGAKAGNPPYLKKYDLTKVGSIILQHPSPGHWVVLKKSPIKSLGDLKGKRIAVGDRGTAGNQRALWNLEIAGIKKDDVTLEYIGDQESAEALADGRIDAYIEYVGVPCATILNLSITSEIRFLELTKDEEQRLKERWPFMYPVTIKAGTYHGQTKDFVAYGVTGCLMVQEEVPEDVVYKMCKAIDENWDLLYRTHRCFRIWKFHKDIETISGQPLHPGAMKFYKETGIIQ